MLFIHRNMAYKECPYAIVYITCGCCYKHRLLGSLLPYYPYWATKCISATNVLCVFQNSGPIGTQLCCFVIFGCSVPFSCLFLLFPLILSIQIDHVCLPM